MVVVCISLGQAVFISYKILKGKETYTLTDYKNSLKKIWFFSMIFFVILFGFFVFGEAYREFAMTLTLGLMIATTLTTPLSYSIAEKVTK
jgi:preprotein translocase subunit SecF